MKKDVKVLQQKLDSIILYIENQLKLADSIDCSNPLRSEYAISLATKLRVLLNDENRNVSLLHLLKIKDKLRFPALKENMDDALSKAPCNLCYTSILTSLTISDAGVYCKANDYQAAEDLVYTFDAWWNEIIIDSKSEQLGQISRRDVVLTLSDKEGGAHVDANYDEVYYQALKRSGFIVIMPSGEERHLQNDVYSEAMLFLAKEFLNSYYVHRNLKPHTFKKETSCYKILQLTYFRAKEKKSGTVYEKRYRFLRYKNNHINDAIMLWFDYYQLASYRLLDLYQISNRCSNGKFIYAQVIDVQSHSEQIVYARTEDRRIHIVLLKNKYGYKPAAKINYVDDKYVSLNKILVSLSPEDPHAFDIYLSKQIINEP